jgi:hypothetical protein
VESGLLDMIHPGSRRSHLDSMSIKLVEGVTAKLDPSSVLLFSGIVTLVIQSWNFCSYNFDFSEARIALMSSREGLDKVLIVLYQREFCLP